MKTYTISHPKLRNSTVSAPDGLVVRFDGTGKATTTDEHTAAYFASVPRLQFTVEPEPTPLQALPPRAAPPPLPPPVAPPARPNMGPKSGDLGMDFEEEEQHPNEGGQVVNPEHSPLAPEVMASVLRQRYEADSDRIEIARGLLPPEVLVQGIMARLDDDAAKLAVFNSAFPDALARLRELEGQRNQDAESIATTRVKLKAADERIAELEAALTAANKDKDKDARKRR